MIKKVHLGQTIDYQLLHRYFCSEKGIFKSEYPLSSVFAIGQLLIDNEHLRRVIIIKLFSGCRRCNFGVVVLSYGDDTLAWLAVLLPLLNLFFTKPLVSMSDTLTYQYACESCWKSIKR